MTAALYDVKAKLSEYITMAENGEVIEITKHGVATTVLISLKTYNELTREYEENHQPSFLEKLRKWKERTGGMSQEDAEEFCNLLENLREEERIKSIEEEKNWRNPWD